MFSKKKLHKTPDRIRPGCLVGEQRRTESDKRIHRTKYRTKDMKKPQNSYLVKIGDHFFLVVVQAGHKPTNKQNDGQ